MISRSSRGNFFATHYEWIAAGVGAVALIGATAFWLFGGDVEQELDEILGPAGDRGATQADVTKLDLAPYNMSTNVSVARKNGNNLIKNAVGFFASDRRVICRNPDCERATPNKYDNNNRICAFCGATQELAKVQKVLDTDGDGMPDTWEMRNGFNPNDAEDAAKDADGDDFTNLEEFRAQTDPKDPKSHPNYLDSLSVQLPLKRTFMPFVFVAANRIPTGWRCEFFDPRQKDDYGRMGRTLTAVIGEEIGRSGFVLRDYQQKSVKRAIKGSVNMKEVDASQVVLERKSDKKNVTLTVAANKKEKPAPVDVQATLIYSRRGMKSFDVVPGAELTLSGKKYRIDEIKAVEKGAAVVVEEVPSGIKRNLQALEP